MKWPKTRCSRCGKAVAQTKHGGLWGMGHFCPHRQICDGRCRDCADIHAAVTFMAIRARRRFTVLRKGAE